MTEMPDDVLASWFHQASLAVGFVAVAGGWLADSERVRRAVYALYETGELPSGEVGLATPPGRRSGWQE